MSERDSLLPLDGVLRAVHGKVLGLAHNTRNFCFTSVVTDSRNVAPGALFVPLVGSSQDGHSFIPAAMAAGARAAFVQKDAYEKNPPYFMGLISRHSDGVFIIVEQNMRALQDLARFYLLRFPGLVRVGVTGSSGKTTTRQLISAVLAQKYSVVSTEGNLNSETGLPLSIFAVRPEHEIGVFEMGMNRRNEMYELSRVLRPCVGVVTNIGSAHIGQLGSRQRIAEEKKHIFDYFDEQSVAVLPHDDDFTPFLLEGVAGKRLYFGADTERIRFIADMGLDGTVFSVDGVEVALALPGSHNYRDAQAAVVLGLELGLTARQIKAGIESVRALFGRSQILRGKYTLIQDCYNANPDSMEKAIDMCCSAQSSAKKWLVLGDMLELGDDAHLAHGSILRKAARSSAHKIFCVGAEFMACGQEMADSGHIAFFPESDDEAMRSIAACIETEAGAGDIILVKGSRSMGLERVCAQLEVHGA